MHDNLLEGGKKLPLIEDFYTIQGEGYHTGKAAYFIRIGGCDIGCQWCDTKHSWNAAKFPPVPTDEIIDRAVQHAAKAVVVTGGEPSMYPLDYFTNSLKKSGIETFIETSGAYPLTGKWDWICLSPKRNMPPVDDIFVIAHELKMIIQTTEDLKWAEENASKVNDRALLFLQPEWSVAPKIIPELVEYIKENPKWQMSLQSHKYMRIP